VAGSLGGKKEFYEYYNCFSGQGLGSPRVSWTMAAVLHILEKETNGLDKERGKA